jgi:hypothetical protein
VPRWRHYKRTGISTHRLPDFFELCLGNLYYRKKRMKSGKARQMYVAERAIWARIEGESGESGWETMHASDKRTTARP